MTEKQRAEMAARRERNLRGRSASRVMGLPEKRPRKKAEKKPRLSSWDLIAWFRGLPFRHKRSLRQAWEEATENKDAGEGAGPQAV